MGMEEMMGAMGGGMPPMDPAMMGGMDGGMPPMDPTMMGMEAPMQEDDPLAEAGRGGDSIIAHLTPGEVVIPGAVAEQIGDLLVELMGEEAILAHTVGDPSNSINPETGYPEFGWFSKTWNKFVGSITGQRKAEKAAREAAARAALQAKRDAEHMRVFQEKEIKKARLLQAAQSRVGRRKAEILSERKQAVAKATEKSAAGATDVSRVAASRGGSGDIKSSASARASSQRAGYNKFASSRGGLSLALRPSQRGTGRPS
jgi:hypothetical protein